MNQTKPKRKQPKFCTTLFYRHWKLLLPDRRTDTGYFEAHPKQNNEHPSTTNVFTKPTTYKKTIYMRHQNQVEI